MPPSIPIEVKILEPSEEPELLDFMRTNLPEGERFQALWQWRKDGALGAQAESAVIARYNGRIEGCVGIVPVTLTVNGTKIQAQWQQDSLVAEPLRGKGIGKKLVQKGWEGFDFSMAKGTSAAMYRLRKSTGYQDVPNSDYLVRVLRARPVRRGLKTAVLDRVLSLVTGLLPRSGIDPGYAVASITSFGQFYDCLAEVMTSMDILGPIKDKDYLNWRYFHCPGKKYKVFQAEKEGTLGAVVLNVAGAENEEGWIVDMVCHPDEKACAYALISKAIDYLKEQRVKRIFTFATLPAARKWFLRFGFLPSGRSPRFTFRTHSENLSFLNSGQRRWNFWHGDGDVEIYQ